MFTADYRCMYLVKMLSGTECVKLVCRVQFIALPFTFSGLLYLTFYMYIAGNDDDMKIDMVISNCDQESA